MWRPLHTCWDFCMWVNFPKCIFKNPHWNRCSEAAVRRTQRKNKSITNILQVSFKHDVLCLILHVLSFLQHQRDSLSVRSAITSLWFSLKLTLRRGSTKSQNLLRRQWNWHLHRSLPLLLRRWEIEARIQVPKTQFRYSIADSLCCPFWLSWNRK